MKGCDRSFLSGRISDQPVPPEELAQKNVLMFLAEGFEDLEAACVTDIMGWTHYRPAIATVQVTTCALHDAVRGAFGAHPKIDKHISQVDVAAYDALVIPGGFYNRGYEEAYDPSVLQLVQSARAFGKPVATMCIGSLVVAAAGALEGGEATTYPLSSRHDNLGQLRKHGCSAIEQPVVEWNGIISCSGPAYSEEVVLILLAKLIGADAATEVAHKRSGY